VGFCIGASDGCLANLGTGAMREKQAALTIGTSGAIRIAGSKPLKTSASMIFNYILEKDIFISGGPVNNGGNIVQWLIRDFLNRNISEEKAYLDLFGRAEKIVSGCGGLVFLPYLHGERAPVWDEETTGVYFGIRSFHNQDFFIRAALEGICFALKQVMENLEEAAGKIEEVQVSGGFIKSAFWMQLLADITEKKLCLVQQEDASATGAAFLAMKALKKIDHVPVFPMENQKVFYPDENLKDVYKKNYQIYLKLYPALMEAMHLNLKS
jgi:gluconokinase